MDVNNEFQGVWKEAVVVNAVLSIFWMDWVKTREISDRKQVFGKSGIRTRSANYSVATFDKNAVVKVGCVDI